MQALCVWGGQSILGCLPAPHMQPADSPHQHALMHPTNMVPHWPAAACGEAQLRSWHQPWLCQGFLARALSWDEVWSPINAFPARVTQDNTTCSAMVRKHHQCHIRCQGSSPEEIQHMHRPKLSIPGQVTTTGSCHLPPSER